MSLRAPCIATAVAMAVLSACAKEPPPPPEHPVLQYRFKKPLLGLKFSPDGTRVLHSVEEATGDSLLTTAIADGSSELVTKTAPGELRAYSYFRTRPMILWSMGPTTRDMTHQFTRAADGTVTDLTPGDNVHTVFYGWSDDGASFYYGSNRTDRRFLYLHSMDAGTLKFDVALQTQDTHFVVAAPNRRQIALTKPSPGMGAEMFTYNFDVRKLVRLSPPGAGHIEIAQFFTPDSTSLVYLSDVDSGMLHLRRREIGSDKSEPLFPEATKENILYARRSLQGKYLALGVAHGAVAKPLLVKGEDGSPVHLKGFDGLDWDIHDISADERLMSYTNLAGAAGNLSVYDFETGEHRTLRP